MKIIKVEKEKKLLIRKKEGDIKKKLMRIGKVNKERKKKRKNL